MKSVLLLVLVSSTVWATQEGRILNWVTTPGISEAEAFAMTKTGFANFLTWDDEGTYCTAEEFWGFEYDEANLTSGEPAFAVQGYARGPFDQCAGETDFDCRTVFTKNAAGAWQENYTDCEPTGFEE